MKRSYWMTAAALALVAFAPTAWAAPAPGDKSPLSWVPATAPIVIHANGPEALRDHVVAFLKNAVPDQADRVEQHFDALLKEGVQGRKLRGLAKDGPVFIVLMDLPPAAGPSVGPPKGALIAAVSDYAAFRDNILTADEKKTLKTGDAFESAQVGGVPVFFVDKKDYVVFTTDMSVAASYAKSGSGAEGAASLDGKLSKAQAAKFLASDLGLYVNFEDVNAKYADQIKAARKAVDDQLDQMESALAAQKAQFEMVKKLIGPIFQAVQDGKTALATLQVDSSGVTYHEELQVRSGTPTADLLKTAKMASFAELAKLPAGNVFYAGMEIDPTLLKFGGALLTGLAANPDAKGAKEFQEAFDDWTKAGPSEIISAITYPVAGVTVLKCTDPEKALAANIKMIQAMGAEGGFQNVFLKDKPEVKPNAAKYGEIGFTSIHVVWDLEKTMGAAAPGVPDALKKQMVEGMKKLMGEDLNVWVGVDGKSMINVMAKDWESAKKTLDQFTKGQGAIGDDKGFAAARKQLPEQASVVVLVDVVQYVGDLLDFITPIVQASGAELPAKFPKPVKDKPGFVGFAITLQSDGAALDVAASADTVKLVYQSYISPLLPKD